MNDLKAIEENIEKQLVEIEILSSIYSNLNEFIIEDPLAVVEAKQFLTDQILPSRSIGFIIKFTADIAGNKSSKNQNESDYIQLPLEIICRLPIGYPLNSPPTVFVHCLKQNLNRKFSEELNDYSKNSHTNDCSILNIIDWVKENINRFLNNNQETDGSNHKPNSPKSNKNKFIFSRIFIYFHHIYSPDKRKSIVDWAKDLDLRGFCKPGKPGILCAEGRLENVEEYWTRLRNINWQKIQIKDNQKFEIDETKLADYIKFDKFEEKYFSDNPDSSDMGLLFQYLKEKDLGDAFNLFFGVDGRLPSS